MTERDIESTWGIRLPSGFHELHSEADWNALRLLDGQVLKVPGHALSAKEIVDAFEVREDWQLPGTFLPLVGDFHDLIGLDFSSDPPRVVALNEERSSQFLFADFDAFLAARFLADESPSDTSGIIEGESWLDI